MLQRLNRWASSRAAALVLMAAAGMLAYYFARGVISRRPAAGGAGAGTLVVIPHPPLEAQEPVSRDHLKASRERADNIAGNGRLPQSHRGHAYGELARVYMAYDFQPGAIAAFHNAAVLEPNEFRWWYGLAEANELAGHVPQALQAMARALVEMETDMAATPPDHFAAYCFLSDLLIRSGKNEDARGMLESALKLQPGSSYALARLGYLASQRGDHKEAREYLQRALVSEPDHPRIRFLLAAEYRSQGDLEKAAKLIGRSEPSQARGLVFPDPIRFAIDELNQSSSRQVRLGAAQMAADRYSSAAQFFARAVQINPKNTEARTRYGLALLNLAQYEDAVKQLEPIVHGNAAAEGTDRARWGLTMAYNGIPSLRAKAIAEALAWKQRAPGSLEALNLVASVYSKQHRYKEAYDAYDEAARLDAGVEWAHLGRGVMAAATGRHAEARRILETAAAAFPDSEQIRHNLARLLATSPEAQVRDGARAMKLMQEMFGSQPSPIRGETLALALAEAGRFDEAATRARWAVVNYRGEAGPSVGARLKKVQGLIESRKVLREPWPFADE